MSNLAQKIGLKNIFCAKPTWAFFTLFDNRPDRDLLIPWAVATAGSAVATALICGVISLVVRELGSESD